MAAVSPYSTAAVLQRNRSRRTVTAVLTTLAGLAAGLAVAALALSGKQSLIAVIPGIFLPVLFWRVPRSAIVVTVLMATLVEEFPVGYASLTDRLPLFKSLSDAGGLKGVYVNPAELILIVAFLIWAMKAIIAREFRIPRTHLAIGLGALLVVVLVAEVHGLARGGDVKQSLWEVRPWAYLVFLYILASQLLPAGQPLKVIAWPFVIGSGLKGIQGTFEFLLNRNVIPRPDTILAHEEAVFFSCYVILTAAMWVFGLKGRLRTVATVLLPFVILADLANGRRTAWVILPACLTVVAVTAWVRHPARRKPIALALAAVAIVGGLYLPLFWNGSGTLSQPARALRSAIYPNTRDANSDAYRLIEDTNLWAEIKYSPIWGTGFGIQIQEVVPNVDLSNIDPSIKYIQHNQILYLWWRTGTLGAIAFWWVVGSAMIAACALARTRDTQTLVLGTFVAAVLVAYVVEGWYDMGLTSFRVELFMGCLLGALEAARRPVKAAPPPAATRALVAARSPRSRIAVEAASR